MSEAIGAEESPRPSFVPSVDTLALERLMMEIDVGESLTYAAMSSEIGRDVQGVARWVMQSARKRAFNADGRVFDVVQNVGLLRLNDSQVVDTSDRAGKRVRSIVRQQVKRLTQGVNFDALPREKQSKHNTYLSVFGVIRQFTSTKSIAKIGAAVSKTNAPLPLAKTFEKTLGQFGGVSQGGQE